MPQRWCSTAHKPLLHGYFRSDHGRTKNLKRSSNTFLPKMVLVIVGSCCHACASVHFSNQLQFRGSADCYCADSGHKDVNGTRWQRSYTGYFGFDFVKCTVIHLSFIFFQGQQHVASQQEPPDSQLAQICFSVMHTVSLGYLQ